MNIKIILGQENSQASFPAAMFRTDGPLAAQDLFFSGNHVVHGKIKYSMLS